MKRLKIVFAVLVSACAGLVSWKEYRKPPQIVVKSPVLAPITLCGSVFTDWSDTTLFAPRIFSGLGNLSYRITTRSEEAQKYFNQGLRLVYAFNHWEAIQSFRQATRLDPECAMAYWGLALAYGPNLNDVNPADREKFAFESIQKAIARKKLATPVEQDLIDAMAKRYDGKAHSSRDTLNLAYADAMKAVAKKYPADYEVLTQCADAIMNTMPWNYWEEDGAPKAGTTEARMLLERVLAEAPDHAGAHHLYIHLVEASATPEVAMASAKFLEGAMPAAGHLVHMPAHIYLRTGQYDRSIFVNERAVLADEEYLSNSDNRGAYRWGYYPHNVDFIAYSAYMEGRSRLGIQSAMKLAYKGSLMTQSNSAFAQYLAVEPMHAFVRFGRWSDVLSLPDPDDGFLYAQQIAHFSKGLAYLRRNQVSESWDRFNKLDSIAKMDTLNNVYFAMNPAGTIVKIPLNILKGELLLKKGRVDQGLAALRLAVEQNDALRYNEPPDWKIPARHFLGGALIDLGRFNEAEQVFLEDLRRNPENGWALKGLHVCHEKLGRKKDAAATARRFGKAWKNADVELFSSRF